MKFRTIFLLAIFFVSAVWAEEVKLNWPLEIEKPNLTVTLYQPQLESFESNILEGRMALSVKQKDEEPIFGAIWFKTRLLTDTESRIAVLEEFDILRTRFPGVEDSSKVEQFNTMLIKEIEDWNLEMSLDRIIASLS